MFNRKYMNLYVYNAMRRLDKINPGWYNKINLKTLWIGSPSDCVLGQLYGYDRQAPKQLWMECKAFGSYEGAYARDGFSTSIATEAWKKAIGKRQEQSNMVSA